MDSEITSKNFPLRWNRSRSLILSRVMVYTFYLLLATAVVTLPWLLGWYFGWMKKDESLLYPLMGGLWVSAGWAFGALYCLDRLLRNISRAEVFTPRNVRYLRALSWCCFAVAILFMIFCVYYLLGAVVGVLAAFVGLIVRVVKNVFNKAVELQQENDLTV